MIQVNLLPDVKQKLLKLHRTRNLVVSVAILIAISSIASVAIVGGWFFAVKGAEMLADNAIKSEYNKLSETKDLEKALTIKNQLEELSSSHERKNITSRALNLLSVVQSSVGDEMDLSFVEINTTSKTISIEATAENFGVIETFRKTLEKTIFEYKVGDDSDKKIEPAVSGVKITDPTMVEDQKGNKVIAFELEFTYNDAMLLYSSRDGFFKAPKKTIATDSKLNMPTSLFGKSSKNESSGGE